MQSIIDQFQLENPVLLPEAIKVGIINQSFCLKSAVEGGKSYCHGDDLISALPGFDNADLVFRGHTGVYGDLRYLGIQLFVGH